ncbi:MAG: Gfo/Idh/MocA family oxidoreductase [Gemmatimonadetes bacterium]|jgi:predicted dehydrogenase|nr:Gfo/Idh/MocA family oxidoreductase [Gemmatimonadota bacterium]
MIRLLCIGLGGMGHHDWNAALDTGRFTPVGGFDIDEKARAAFAEKTDAPVFTDFSEALTGVEADAALISTPDKFHAPYTHQALDAGLDVICEKPMAETLRDGYLMHFAAVDRGRMLMIHQQLRWNPMHNHARRLIEEGAIGDVRRIDFDMSVFSGVCLSGYRSELPHLILQDLAIHHLDLIRYLSGQECESLYVRDWPSVEAGQSITAATDACAILNMTGPVTACYTSGIRRLMDHVGYACAARICGSEGELSLRDDQITLQTRAAHAAEEEPQVITPEPPAVGTWESFARAIETREPTLTSSGNNLKSLEILFAAIQSAESGEIVSIDSLRQSSEIAPFPAP